MSTRLLSRAHNAVLVLALAALPLAAAAAPVRAQNCGGEYVECQSDAMALGTSDAVHELECWGDYLDCISGAILGL